MTLDTEPYEYEGMDTIRVKQCPLCRKPVESLGSHLRRCADDDE